MPRKKKISACDPSPRDYAMARLAAARANAKSALDLIDQALEHFVDPEGTGDDDGDERNSCYEGAAEALGAATRGLEESQRVWESDDVHSDDGEEYDDEEDEDDEEDDEDEDD